MAEQQQQDTKQTHPVDAAEVQKAMRAIKPNQLREIRSLHNPPQLVKIVMDSVLILLNKGGKPSWKQAKMELGNHSMFLQKFKDFDADNIPDSVLDRVGQLVAQPDVNLDRVRNVSLAASVLFSWIVAVEAYARTSKTAKST